MKTSNFSNTFTRTLAPVALLLALSSTAAFADMSMGSMRGYEARGQVASATTPSSALAYGTSGYITTYPTNADSVLAATQAEREVVIGHHSN